jgi:signal transduction histidine kinase
MDQTPRQATQQGYLQLVSHLSRIVASTADLSEILRSSVQVIQTLLDVENCSIMLLAANGTTLRMGASSVIPEEDWKKISIPVGSGIAGRVAKTGREVVVARTRAVDMGERPQGPVTTPRKYRTDSYICLPLRSEEAILGVVNVTDHVENRQLDVRDFELVQAVAHLIGSAVNNHYQWVRARESREHMSKVMDGLPVGMFTIAPSGELVLCNRAARQYLGLSPAPGSEGTAAAPPSALGEQWSAYFPESVRQHVSRALREIPRGRSFSSEFEVTDQTGTKRRSVRMSALEVEAFASLESRHILFLVEDLQQMQELWELRRSDQMKSTFLSLISHELRTPLASIKGSIHLLNQLAPPEMREKANRLFAILHRNSDRLARLVNNILDVMDLESESLTLYRKRTDLHELVLRVAKRFETSEVEKSIRWTVELKAPISELYVDEGRFGQVVEHLVENAVKFTPDGGEIRVATDSVGGDWVLSVENSGREIDPELREKVFTRFYQVDATLTRDYGGSGLGLYLCREILQLHGGKIWVDPDFKGGARLKVSLPEASKPPESTYEGAGKSR